MAQAPFRQRTTFPATPKIADLIFTEVEMRDRASLPAYGTAHWDTTRYANHKLVLIRPDTSDGAPEDRYLLTYAADRANQDDYNFEHVVADIGDTKYNLVRRTYVTPRDSYNSTSPAMGATMADTPTGMFSGTFVLAGRQESRIGDETLDSRYVAEVRTYIDRVTLSESDFNASSGVSTVRSSNLYYRGELVGGTAIETLVADPNHAYWDGNGGSVRHREFKTLSENWFLVIEIGIGLSDEAKVSRVWDKQLKCFVNVEMTPVTPGTADGTLVGDVLTETNAEDYLQSQKKVEDIDVGSNVSISTRRVDPSDGVVYDTTRTLAAKDTVTAGTVDDERIEASGHEQVDIKETTEAVPPGEPWVEHVYDHDLMAFVTVTRQPVLKGNGASSVVGESVTEVQNHNDLIDYEVTSTPDMTAINDYHLTFPTTVDLELPGVLQNIAVIWNEQSGEGSYDSNPWGVSAGTSYSLSVSDSGSASSSGSLIPELVLTIARPWGRNIPAEHHFFYLPIGGGISVGDILTAVGASQWPLFAPKSDTITLQGGKAGISVKTNVASSRSHSGSSDTWEANSASGVDVDVGNSINAVTLPPTLHAAITISDTERIKQISATSNAVISGYNLPSSDASLTRTLDIVGTVSPASLAATTPETIPTSGLYLYSAVVRPHKWGLAQVSAVVFDASNITL